MTINELYNPIKDAVDNGCGNLLIGVRKYGTSSEQMSKNLCLFNLVTIHDGKHTDSYGELVYKDDCPEEDNEIQYRVGYTQQLADDLQSYRNERQLIFDAWKKSNRESAEMIKDMLNLMKHKMRPCNTERCRDEFDTICHKAEAYLEHINDDIDFLKYQGAKDESV